MHVHRKKKKSFQIIGDSKDTIYNKYEKHFHFETKTNRHGIAKVAKGRQTGSTFKIMQCEEIY